MSKYGFSCLKSLLTKEVALGITWKHEISEIGKSLLCIIYRYTGQYLFFTTIAISLPVGIHLILRLIFNLKLSYEFFNKQWVYGISILFNIAKVRS